MIVRPLLLPALFLSACTLNADGEIATTCDDLGTCNAVETGGIVYVESNNPDSINGEWRAVLLNGYGEILNEWTGRGNPGPIVYDASTGTVYLAVEYDKNEIRILRDLKNGDPVLGIRNVTDAIAIEGGVFFAYEKGVNQILGETLQEGLDTPNGSVDQVFAPLHPEKHTASLLDLSNNKQTLVHIDTSQSPWRADSEELINVPRNRLHDVFVAEGAYYSCSNTGATFELWTASEEISESPDTRTVSTTCSRVSTAQKLKRSYSFLTQKESR